MFPSLHPPSPQSLMGDANDTVRRLSSFGVGAALAYLEPEVQTGIVDNLLKGRSASGGAGGGSAGAGAGAGASGDWAVAHGVRLALYGAVRYVQCAAMRIRGGEGWDKGWGGGGSAEASWVAPSARRRTSALRWLTLARNPRGIVFGTLRMQILCRGDGPSPCCGFGDRPGGLRQ
jgi:hypothetical protein